MAAAQEQAPQLPVRTESLRGIFLVYDAAIPPMHPRPEAGYLAYWNDFDTRALYVYGGLLFDLADVGHALLNLQRDLGIDAGTVSAPSEALQSGLSDAASEAASPTEWFPAGYGTILEIMGFAPSDPSYVLAADGDVPLRCSPPYPRCSRPARTYPPNVGSPWRFWLVGAPSTRAAGLPRRVAPATSTVTASPTGATRTLTGMGFSTAATLMSMATAF